MSWRAPPPPGVGDLIGRLRDQAVGDPETATYLATGFLAPGDREVWLGRLSPVAGAARTLIDLGCGTGRFGRMLSSTLSERLGRRVGYVGVDACPATCAFAAADLDWSGEDPRFVCADLNRWRPEEEERPALVLSNDAFYLADDPAAALARLAPACAGLTFSVYVGADQFEGGVAGRSVETWTGQLATAGFDGVEALDVTPVWRGIARRIHFARLHALDAVAETYGEDVADRTASLAARFLGLDGRAGFLDRTERWILSARGPRG